MQPYFVPYIGYFQLIAAVDLFVLHDRVKYVKTFYPDSVALQAFGTLDPTQGDQVDSATGTRSMRYPLFELKVTSVGEYGNATGIRLWAPTNEKNVMPTKLMTGQKAYPYYIQVIEKQDGLSTPKVDRTIFNEMYRMITLKPGADLVGNVWKVWNPSMEK